MSEESLISEELATPAAEEAPAGEPTLPEKPAVEGERVIPGKYALNLPEELSHVEIPDNDPLLVEAQDFARAQGMDQDTYDKMIQLYAKTHILDAEAAEVHREKEIAALGNDGAGRITRLAQWGQANLSEEQFEGLKEIATSAAAIKTLEHLVSMTRSSSLSPSAVPAAAITADDVRAMQFEKDEHGNRRLSVDPEFRKRYEELKTRVWGSSEARRTVG